MNDRPKIMKEISGFGSGISLNQILDHQTCDVFTNLIHAVDGTMAAWKSDFLNAMFKLKEYADFFDTITADFEKTIMHLWIEEDGLSADYDSKTISQERKNCLVNAIHFEIVFAKKLNIYYIRVYRYVKPQYRK